MLFCAARINAECTISEAASGAPARGSEIMDEAKKFALDRVLYEDFLKSANDSKRAAGALSPVFVMNVPDGAQSARRMPGYAPTVILKALAVLDKMLSLVDRNVNLKLAATDMVDRLYNLL